MRGKSTQIAFVFASEHEAHDFYKKVANRSKYASEFTRPPLLKLGHADDIRGLLSQGQGG